jgi:pimeloyl-ACP methyl ester carboxylesterase
MNIKQVTGSRSPLFLIGAGLFLAFGRYPVSWLLSSKKKGENMKNEMPGESQFIRCPSGNTLYVETDGPEEAQPIVIIHGLNASRLQWYYQRMLLRTAYRLIFIDLPGHGRSERPATLSIPAIASDLDAILWQLGVKNPILYGHSLGGMVLMDYCSRGYSRQIKGVIIQNSSFTNPFKTCLLPEVMLALQQPVIVPFLRFVIRHPRLFGLLSGLNYLNGLSLVFYRFLLFSGAQTGHQLRFLCKLAALCPPEVTAEGILRTLEFNVGAALQKICAPCLVICGTNDRIVRPSAGRLLGSRIPAARMGTIAGGHLNLVEHAHEVNLILRNFLQTIS